jgi:hypothetical protein
MSTIDLDAIRRRDAAWSPGCQYLYPGHPAASSPGIGSLPEVDPRPCSYRREHHGAPPDHIKRHVGPQHDHPFTYDPATDTGPEADRRALLAALDRLRAALATPPAPEAER